MEDMLPPWCVGAGVDTNADGGSGRVGRLNVGESLQTSPEHVVAPMAHGPPTRTAHGSHRLVVVLLNA